MESKNIKDTVNHVEYENIYIEIQRINFLVIDSFFIENECNKGNKIVFLGDKFSYDYLEKNFDKINKTQLAWDEENKVFRYFLKEKYKFKTEDFFKNTFNIKLNLFKYFSIFDLEKKFAPYLEDINEKPKINNFNQKIKFEKVLDSILLKIFDQNDLSNEMYAFYNIINDPQYKAPSQYKDFTNQINQTIENFKKRIIEIFSQVNKITDQEIIENINSIYQDKLSTKEIEIKQLLKDAINTEVTEPNSLIVSRSLECSIYDIEVI